MRVSSSSGHAASALACLGAALLLAVQAPLPTAEAISMAGAKNLTRVLYLHNYPTMLFYKSMYQVGGCGGTGLDWIGLDRWLAGKARGGGGAPSWRRPTFTQPPPVPPPPTLARHGRR